MITKETTLTMKEIRNSKEISDKFIAYFKSELANYGEYLIGNVSDNFILAVFDRQGYWAGVRYNFTYNPELETIEIDQRNFK
jgi:hypothetical protein